MSACQHLSSHAPQDTATQQEAQLRELYTEGELRAGELARLRSEAQAAASDASGASARVRLLESQLQVRGAPQ